MVAPTDDRRRISSRVAVLQVGAVIWFAALAICFWVLQVVQTEKFVEMANSNYQRTLALRAPRGVLFDRDGRILVENRDSFTISIDREATKDLARTIRMAVQELGLDPVQVKQSVDRHVRSEPVYRPIVIVEDATLEQVARVETRQRELPEFLIEKVPTRTYPGEALAAQRVRAVDLVVLATGLLDAVVERRDLHPGVARDRDQVRRLVVGRDVQDDDRVGPHQVAALGLPRPLVDADE